MKQVSTIRRHKLPKGLVAVYAVLFLYCGFNIISFLPPKGYFGAFAPPTSCNKMGPPAFCGIGSGRICRRCACFFSACGWPGMRRSSAEGCSKVFLGAAHRAGSCMPPPDVWAFGSASRCCAPAYSASSSVRSGLSPPAGSAEGFCATNFCLARGEACTASRSCCWLIWV